jgi:phosphatidylinositol phospholipase C delta
MINHAMFQRNGCAGYVLKPNALRNPTKDNLTKLTKHFLDIEVISAQQLPHPKDGTGRKIFKSIIDPFVEVSVFVPDWTKSPYLTETPAAYSPPLASTTAPVTAQQASTARYVSQKTSVVKNNGFNPVWNKMLSLPFDCVGDMLDLVFVRFAVKEDDGNDDEPLAVYCVSLGSLQQGKFYNLG